MRQPTLNEKAAATIEDLELMASLHRTNGDTAAAEEFDDFGAVVRELVNEIEALKGGGQLLVRDRNDLRDENEALRKEDIRAGLMALAAYIGPICTAAVVAAMGKGEQP